jgi:hypothetical protein
VDAFREFFFGNLPEEKPSSSGFVAGSEIFLTRVLNGLLRAITQAFRP